MTDENAKHGTAAKVLLPVAATLASVVASYVAKKGPQYLEETLLPKIRDTKDSSGNVAHDLVDRARSVVGRDGDTDDGDSADGGAKNSAKNSGDTEQSNVSNDELERRRRERAEHRAARRKAS